MPAVEKREHLPLTGAAVWMGADVQNSDEWMYRFTQDDIAEIDAAYRQAVNTEVTLASLTKDQFPLPGLRPVLDRLLHELEDGTGLFLLRGVPVERYAKDDLRFIY
jgi:hypothetical protein